MTKQLKDNIMQSAVSIVLMVGTATVMLSSQFPLIRKVSEYSVHLMLGLLAFGLFSLVVNKSKMMFAAFACSAAMCIFLKNASNNTLKLPEVNQEASLKVAHVNLSNITFDFDQVKSEMDKAEVEVISFQELTPDWDYRLKEELRSHYPYAKSIVRIDPYGMAIYSKVPFATEHTFQCGDKSYLDISIEKDKELFELISSYLTPALEQNSIETASKQLKTIASQVTSAKHPVLALGEYNMVYWTNEIREFTTSTSLTNSRRGLTEGLRVPYDHIFFSPGLECTEFRELKDSTQNYIGIIGTYQIKRSTDELSLSEQLHDATRG